MKKIKAFTLIETLIVIVVFCVGILTVLYGLSQTLRNKEYANTQIQSAFFAREGIELVFNLRDANYHKELDWNCIFTPVDKLKKEYSENENPFCKESFEPGKVLKLDMGKDGEYMESPEVHDLEAWDLNDEDTFDKVFENYQIYKHVDNDSFKYNHVKDNGEETGFARFIVIKGIEGLVNSTPDQNLVNKNLLKIESHVLYKKGIFKGEKVMETFIGNYEFNE